MEKIMIEFLLFYFLHWSWQFYSWIKFRVEKSIEYRHILEINDCHSTGLLNTKKIKNGFIGIVCRRCCYFSNTIHRFSHKHWYWIDTMDMFVFHVHMMHIHCNAHKVQAQLLLGLFHMIYKNYLQICHCPLFAFEEFCRLEKSEKNMSQSRILFLCNNRPILSVGGWRN